MFGQGDPYKINQDVAGGVLSGPDLLKNIAMSRSADIRHECNRGAGAGGYVIIVEVLHDGCDVRS